jgi:hypothetical protein
MSNNSLRINHNLMDLNEAIDRANSALGLFAPDPFKKIVEELKHAVKNIETQNQAVSKELLLNEKSLLEQELESIKTRMSEITGSMLVIEKLLTKIDAKIKPEQE